jgi:hypothetical protein
VKRTLAALAVVAGVVAVASGCGSSSTQSAPTENPGQVMKAVIRHELSGQRNLSYGMLVSEQRKLVPVHFYLSCSPGPTMQESVVDVGILGVHDQVFAVPALGRTKTKAVSYRIDFHDGSQPITDTGHLIAQEGHWRWTLSASSLESLTKGFCP